ncbi:MAG: flagellar biosynthesis protein FlhB [Halieaceae bacterium MED-G27]|nr:MAG: flagellar biosynthesis protein FlhB [Halieaceae bacterium MED-G27]
MAENSDDSQEKTEEPTERKISKAREEGQIARSQEVAIAASVIIVAAYLFVFGTQIFSRLSDVMIDLYTFDAALLSDQNRILTALYVSIERGLVAILPLMAFALLTVLAFSGLVGGYNFSFKAVAPKLNKLNPLTGLKRIFSMRSIVELLKALLKFLLVGGIAFLLIAESVDDFAQISLMSLKPGLSSSAEIIAAAFFIVACGLIVIAAIDAPYQIYQHSQKLKMSLKEVKDERKETDGSPEVKQKIREKQRQASFARMMEAVADADVVITNPEHFAIALSYDPTADEPPKVVAKGVDLVALRIKERSKEEGVPLFESPMLARALYFTTELDQFIPEPLFEAVAQVIAYIFNLSTAQSAVKNNKPTPRVPDDMLFDSEGRSAEIFEG